jgi:uncharacterized protein YjiS (DUF1127 family)
MPASKARITPQVLYRSWRRYWNVRQELSLFNDRDLLDLGIRRSDIRLVARAAAVEDILVLRQDHEIRPRPPLASGFAAPLR